MVIDHSKWISRTETAILLDVDKTTVERWERFKKMPYKSVNIKGTNYYNRQEMLDFKASGGIQKTGCGRPRGYVVMPDEQKEKDENEDIWMIRKKQPCFEYPEHLINFYQPSRLNRNWDIDRLLNASD